MATKPEVDARVTIVVRDGEPSAIYDFTRRVVDLSYEYSDVSIRLAAPPAPAAD